MAKNDSFVHIRDLLLSQLVDERTLAYVGHPTCHQPKSDPFVLVAVLICQVSDEFPHIFVLSGAQCHAGHSYLLVLTHYFACLFGVAKVVLIENDYSLLLVTLDELLKLWVATSIRNTGITDLEEEVDTV